VALPADQIAVTSEVVLAVRVRDAAGAPAAGVSVRWTAAEGGIVSQPQVTTDATGLASTLWQLGSAAGSQTATATVVTSDTNPVVDFAVTAVAGPAAFATLQADTVLLSAQGETAFLGPAFFDVWGNEAEPRPVEWRSSNPAVITVAADGLITAVDYGEAWIFPELETTVDSIRVTSVPRGAITVTFDDGFRSAYQNAIPIMTELGLRGNVGVYTEAVGWPDYMTEAQLAELHEAGWSMPSHSVSHDTLTLLTPAELDDELRDSREWLDARGFRGSNVFVAPYLEFGERERINTSQYYIAARGESARRTEPDTLVAWRPDNPFKLTGVDADALPFTTEEGRAILRGLLERTVSEGSFLDVFFHRVQTADTAGVRATLELVAEYGERVLPYHELFPTFARTVR
jgi:peptidoglycan/xylan/chitin deacetylase (PgdA/CDA1 family)